MLTNHRAVSLSFISTDLPILNTLETSGILYERENNKFHLILKEANFELSMPSEENKISQDLLWLEISPYRVILTKQSQKSLNYRYFWEAGVYGIQRYWLNNSSSENNQNFRLRNFTRNLTLKHGSNSQSLRIDYELWTERLNLGHYVLSLDIN